MPPKAAKKTAHQWADELTAEGGMRAYLKKLVEKHGPEYVADWLTLHKKESRWARRMLRAGSFNLLDTETTSVNDVAEVVELSLVDRLGREVFDSMLRPSEATMTKGSTNITGITMAELRTAPALLDLHGSIQRALDSQPVLVIYNAEFDVRVIDQSCFHARLPLFRWPVVEDLLKHFSRWVGDWNAKFNEYSWPRLEGGHRARGDCLAMISLMEKMARIPQTDEDWSPT